jgi:hypothetical protein
VLVHTSAAPSAQPAAALQQDACSSSSVVSFPLAQTGEGISECELMQWFVKVRR